MFPRGAMRIFERLLPDHHRREKALPDSIDDGAWQKLRDDFPIIATLPEPQTLELRRLAGSFLRRKSIEGAGNLELDDEARLIVAAMACLPVLNLGIEACDGWRSVIVYPGEFISRGIAVDEAGVESQWEERCSGESWERGPIVLSWDDILASGQLESGYNVVIHEIAHKLDMRSGDVNGFPLLHPGMDGGSWYRDFSAAFEDFCARTDAGLETQIDPYAAESPDEFFAVVSEYFFECPAILKGCYPAVHDQLMAYYRQDPLSRIPSNIA
ncbi:zinc-dependent peptidase [Thioalkalivibrio sp. HK1]|uniref:M90 family metallopeptidase n=1 Tax=Thioalkalivibrio sp. HK1 TaxID=1469245 RepID=UPI0012DFD7BC|nr:M90 family metallopeptidase [Thioalkalivibrio sp. HK1]